MSCDGWTFWSLAGDLKDLDDAGLEASTNGRKPSSPTPGTKMYRVIKKLPNQKHMIGIVFAPAVADE